MISNDEIERITTKLIEDSFYKYFSNTKKETKHIILDRFFPNERRITSTMSGIQTSLGTFWEKLAKQLASINGFEIIDNFNLQMPQAPPEELKTLVASVKTTRENQGGDFSILIHRLNELYSAPLEENIEFKKITKGKGSDVILKRNDRVYIFDTKTVQVNANNGNSFNETLILWLSYYQYQYRIGADNIYPMLVFPYNSSDENNDAGWWAEYGQRVSPLQESDVYVGNQFWSFLTDNQTAISGITAALNKLTLNEDFITMYHQVFSCEDQEELKAFSFTVKIFRVLQLRNVKFIGVPFMANGRRLLDWSHGDDCEFRSRIKPLLSEEAFTCPTCNTSL